MRPALSGWAHLEVDAHRGQHEHQHAQGRHSQPREEVGHAGRRPGRGGPVHVQYLGLHHCRVQRCAAHRGLAGVCCSATLYTSKAMTHWRIVLAAPAALQLPLRPKLTLPAAMRLNHERERRASLKDIKYATSASQERTWCLSQGRGWVARGEAAQQPGHRLLCRCVPHQQCRLKI